MGARHAASSVRRSSPPRGRLTFAFLSRTAALALAVGWIASPAAADEPTPAPVPAPTPSRSPAPTRAHGYLEPSELPDSLALLPAPPAVGSPAAALDAEIARFALTLQGTPRFAQAARDADLSFPNAPAAFACTMGASITQEKTPTLYHLLQRTLADAGAATGKAKEFYRHARPFMIDEKPTCTPEAEDAMRKSGSYPSSHSSIGWAWGEILGELAPDRASALIARGRAFGESRIVCNAHWASDVMEGRLVGAATVVALHGKAEFRDDLAMARTEFWTPRARPPRRRRIARSRARRCARRPG